MGLFSKSKPKASEKTKLMCVSGDAASYKCIFIASYRKVPVDIEWCESSTLDDKMAASLNMSNLSRYPCVEDGDFTVCGESAVLTYLNIKGRTPTIHPRKARVLAMQQYWIQVLATRCNDKESIPAVLDELEKELEGKKHIVGEFSLADIHWAAALKALEESGSAPDISNYKNIGEWYARMKSEIPSFEVSGEKAAA
jgi:glutathione S-transferase